MGLFNLFFWLMVIAAISWVIFYFAHAPAPLPVIAKIGFFVFLILVIAIAILSAFGGRGPHAYGFWF